MVLLTVSISLGTTTEGLGAIGGGLGGLVM